MKGRIFIFVLFSAILTFIPSLNGIAISGREYQGVGGDLAAAHRALDTSPSSYTDAPGLQATVTTTRVSVASDGTQGNGYSSGASLSADGRYVSFFSDASNLVPGDTNGTADVFVHDRVTGETTRVSVASDRTEGNGRSVNYTSTLLSADGQVVTFVSNASNLVSEDTNGITDVFVHDRVTGHTTRVSVASDGTQGNSFSRYPSLSADGRYVAFGSNASNLVPGDTNGADDIFVHDRVTGETTRVSVASDGTQGDLYSFLLSLSADGQVVAFHSNATNLVAGDTNGHYDVFVHDRVTGETTRVSVRSDGAQGNNKSYAPSISADGRYVAFTSDASNLVMPDSNGRPDVFMHDRMTKETTRVSVASDGTQGDLHSWYPSLSTDGRYVAFFSLASNLVPEDTNEHSDVFVHDRLTKETSRVSVASDGTQGDSSSMYVSLSADGHTVAFESYASNLVLGDTNGVADIFVRDWNHPACTLPSFGDANGNALMQKDIRWAGDPYGGTDFTLEDGQTVFLPFRHYGDGKDTIGEWGCALTSAAMIVNYYSAQQGKTFRTDPKALNEWLQHHEGYSCGNILPNRTNPEYVDSSYVIYDKVREYAELVGGVAFAFDGYDKVNKDESMDQFIARTREMLDRYMCDLNPVILGVNGGGHYIDGTGKVQEDDLETWRIHDPLYANVTTLDQLYGNQYSNMAKYSAEGARGALSIYIHSPVDLVITNPQGQRTGFDPTLGIWLAEIPSSSYGEHSLAATGEGGGVLECALLDIRAPISGDYLLHVVGTGSGAYALDVFATVDGVKSEVIHLAGTASLGETYDYLLSYASMPEDPIVINSPPTVTAGGPYSVNEGNSLIVTALGSDPEGSVLTFAWDLDSDGVFEVSGQNAVLSAALLDGPDSLVIAVEAIDDVGLSTIAKVIVNVLNAPPTVDTIMAPPAPVQVDSTIIVSGSFTDPGVLDTHTAEWEWGDGTTSTGLVTEANGSGTVTGNHVYTTPGVYMLKLTVTDDDGDAGMGFYQYIVVYDPDGGFVTGGGWINSPMGAYTADPFLTGKATFGFVSKYKKGAAVPTGQTEFQFKAGDLNFHSSSYDWLVIAGAKAMYKGVGTINGQGNYGFLISAIDADLTPSTNIDLFRIKIWDKDASDVVVYDNQIDQPEDVDPTAALGGGSIVIHKGA